MKRTRQLKVHKTNLPTKWNADRSRQAFKLALLGLTDVEMADVMDININTFNMWKREHPRFLQKLRAGKIIADAKVAHALYKRATGFTVEEIHVCQHQGTVIQTPVMKYYPPDSWAANKFLSVRQRTLWADIMKTEHTNTNININKFDFTGISDEELMFLEKIGLSQRQKQIASHVDPCEN